MKILLIFPSAEFATYDVATGIKAGLASLGYEVVDYRLYRRLQLMHRGLAQMAPEGKLPKRELTALHASEALPYKAITEGTRWVLAINGNSLHPNALWALRRIGVKVAIWFTEAPYETSEVAELYLARFADLAFVNERTSVKDFQRILDEHTGGRAIYLPHAYNPEVHHSPEGEILNNKHDVVLVGTGFLDRQWLLERIDWTGIDLCLGGLWPYVEPPHELAYYLKYSCLDNRDTVQLYHGAKIVLNPHRWADGAESTNPRTYEVAACGTFQIADRRKEILEIFGDSIPQYEPGVPWQLEALIRHYLEDDKGRKAKAEMARRRVQPHTFEARAKTILENIGEVNNQ